MTCGSGSDLRHRRIHVMPKGRPRAALRASTLRSIGLAFESRGPFAVVEPCCLGESQIAVGGCHDLE